MFVDLRDHIAQIGFGHAVKLQSATRRNSNRSVPEAIGEIVDRNVEAGGQETARILRAHHETVGFSTARRAGRSARVAIVLLIDAVKLQQRSGFLAEMVRQREFVRDRTAQSAAIPFERFDVELAHDVSRSFIRSPGTER